MNVGFGSLVEVVTGLPRSAASTTQVENPWFEHGNRRADSRGSDGPATDQCVVGEVCLELANHERFVQQYFDFVRGGVE